MNEKPGRLDPLTPREQERQNIYVDEMSKLVDSLLTEDIEHTGSDENEIGILMSGGADSQLMLGRCLAMGLKPKLFTLGINERWWVDGKPHPDQSRARKIAKKLELDLTEIPLDVPDDGDKVANQIFELVQKWEAYKTPDIDVVWTWNQITKFLAEEHPEIKMIISGIMDGGVSMANRKIMKREKAGALPVEYLDQRRLDWMAAELDCQMNALPGIMLEKDITLTCSLADVSRSGILMGSSFRELNRPRPKNILVEASLLKEKIGLPKISPMNSKRGGIQPMLDHALLSSKRVKKELNGAKSATRVKWYNQIQIELGMEKIPRDKVPGNEDYWLDQMSGHTEVQGYFDYSLESHLEEVKVFLAGNSSGESSGSLFSSGGDKFALDCYGTPVSETGCDSSIEKGGCTKKDVESCTFFQMDYEIEERVKVLTAQGKTGIMPTPEPVLNQAENPYWINLRAAVNRSNKKVQKIS